MTFVRFLAVTISLILIAGVGIPTLALAQVPAPINDAIKPSGTSGDNPLTTSFTYMGNNDVVVDTVAFTGSSSESGSFTVTLPAGSTVVQAFLYTNSWFAAGSASGTFDANALPSIAAHSSDANEPSSYRWDVTPFVSGSGSYPFTLTTPAAIYHATLVVVYSNPSNPTQQILINDGSEGLQFSSSTTDFNGVIAGSGRLVVVTQADDNFGTNEELKFNGITILGPADVFNSNQGSFASLYDVNVNTVSGLNSATIVTQDDWFGWHLAILVSEIDEVKVGGNLLSIDSTALLLAGLQSSAIWMVPVMVGVAGVGIYLVRSRI